MTWFSGGPNAAMADAPNYAFTNGQWWTGARFERKTIYSINGELREHWRGGLDETIDLENGYVIPPLAEGHIHLVEPSRIEAYNVCYLADGVFYVRDLGNSPYIVNQFRDRVNLPTSIDFVSALQMFNGRGAYPIEVWNWLSNAGTIPAAWGPDFDPEAQFVVETAADVDESFAMARANNVRIIKIGFTHADEYEARRNDPAMYNNRGIDPRLAPHLVDLAHRQGMSAIGHAYSRGDFRIAVESGVDEISHLPGGEYDPALDLRYFLLTDQDAQLAGARGVRVMTTLASRPTQRTLTPEQHAFMEQQILIPNLRLLRRYNVPLLIGGDLFRHTSLDEVLYLGSLGEFSNQELIRMATYDTPRAIFPNRRIGQLQNGYEANFLVLDRDPMIDLSNLSSIRLRVKNGRRLTVPEDASHRPSRACLSDGARQTH